LKYLAQNGCTFCLTTAWAYYDDYLRDPAVHAYLPSDRKQQDEIINELAAQPPGMLAVFLYPQDLAVTPVKFKGLPLTSEIRTLLDLYTSNYAYGVQPWIKKKVEKMLLQGVSK
jgi:hypothetical protein